MPYLDNLRWVFIAIALIGIAVVIHARIDDWKRGPTMIGWIIALLASGPARKALGPLLASVTLALFLLNLRRTGDQTGRLTERPSTSEKTHEIQRQMLDAAGRRPADRDALADRLRDGRF